MSPTIGGHPVAQDGAIVGCGICASAIDLSSNENAEVYELQAHNHCSLFAFVGFKLQKEEISVLDIIVRLGNRAPQGMKCAYISTKPQPDCEFTRIHLCIWLSSRLKQSSEEYK